MSGARLLLVSTLIVAAAATRGTAQPAESEPLVEKAESEVQIGRPCSRPNLTHAAARGGYLAVSQPANHRVALYDIGADRLAFATTLGGGQGSSAGQFNGPSGVAIDAQRRLLFVSDTNNHRIQVFRLSDLGAPVGATFAKAIGRQGSELGELDRPTALSLDGKGNLYVVEKGNGRVQVFSAEMRPLRTFGTTVDLRDPLAVAAAPSGQSVFLADAGLRRVQTYTSDGGLGGALGKARDATEEPRRPGSFFYPADLAISNDGTILVTDCGDHVVHRFDPHGKVLAPWGRFGLAAGALNQPRAITVDERDRVFVLDFSDRRAQVFTPTGAYKGTFRLGPPSSAQK